MSRAAHLGVALGTALLVLATAGTALAADPKAATAGGQSGPLVGFVNDVAGKTPEQLGYTAADVAAKQAQYNQVAAKMSANTVYPGVGIGGYIEYHQKTTSWCLAATLQSILRYRWGSTWVSPTVLSKQTSINSHTGTNESNAIAYLNSQLQGTFTYIVYAKSNLSVFQTAIRVDIENNAMPSYTTVDVSSTQYAWHQSSPANHATTVTAYDTGIVAVDQNDPFTSPNTGSGCKAGVSNPAYSSTPDKGCVYPSFDITRLFNASEHQWY
jgi:hypothetical protein